jgi:hypothetical protein
MEKVCKNCEYFEQGSTDISKYVWGDCRKAASSAVKESDREFGSFTWGDKTCGDFKPKQQLE